MVMPVSGTFDYTFVVPSGSRSGSRRMKGTLTAKPGWHDRRRLLGRSAILEAVEYQKEAWQLYSRLTLTAGNKWTATARSFAFSVDRALIVMLRQDDVLNISRTACAGLGLSVLREGRLVAAAGAVSAVPLGPDVSVRHTFDLVQRAEAIFRVRDPEYEMKDHPVELRVGNVTRILHVGRPTIGDYEVLVRHGFIAGMPGTNESVSIELRRVCPDTAAHTSAQLMEQEGQELLA